METAFQDNAFQNNAFQIYIIIIEGGSKGKYVVRIYAKDEEELLLLITKFISEVSI